jgi:SAM-dependent methyltransferase
MKSSDKWKPGKFVYRNGRLRASRDSRELGIGSRLVTDLVAKVYGENLPLFARGRLLDLGCGKVPLYLAYKDLVTECVCVDWENTLHKNEYLDSHCDLTQALPFADGEFDTIILSDVLEHLPQPELLWREMTRILAPGGRILMNVPFYYQIHEHPHDFYRYTEFALRRFVQEAGLTLVKLEAIGGAPEILADVFAKNVRRWAVVGRPLAIFTQWLAGAFVRTGVGKRASESTRANFPFGYFLVAEKP